MSRIISDNYIQRISKLINSYSLPIKLVNTIEFFSMEIKSDLSSIGNRNRKVFSELDLIKVCKIQKSTLINVLYSYLNILIKSFEGMHLHIHVNKELTESHTECIETLFYWDIKTNDAYELKALNEDLNNLEIKSNLPIELSSGNNGHDENRLRRERKGIKHKIKIIKLLLKNELEISDVGILLNLNKSSINTIYISDFSKFPSSLNSYINFGDRIQSIYNNNNTILSKVHTIINLFPATTGPNIWYNDFIAENTNEWNRLEEINFQKIITITSGEKTQEGLSEMLKLNKFQAEEIYIIYPFELNKLRRL